MESVWKCGNIATICRDICTHIRERDLPFRIERALKVAKWLFIKQDITDWNTSGRAMLMDGIRKHLAPGGLL